MAWTAPATAVAGTVVTAAMFNASIRDNLIATGAGVSTTTARIIVTTGPGGVAERIPDSATIATNQTTASLAYGDLATVGPAVSVNTGGRAMAITGVHSYNDTANQGAYCAAAMSGAWTEPAGDANAVAMISKNANDSYQASWVTFHTIAAGITTWTLKYRAFGGGTANFAYRTISVVPF